jgi:predicted AAA+ superfamily ATPase
MISRSIHDRILDTLREYPILAITGPRQSGKTTLLKTMLQGYTYVNLENPENRTFAEMDTKGFLDKYNDKVIFDEAQNVPALFSYLQGIVDENQVMGQFILSGSQNFQLTERITQSLAGRVAIFRLLPFDMDEMSKANWLSEDLGEAMTKGFYPAIFERGMDHDRYYTNYIETYVTRDISQLINIKDARSFRNFLKLCAVRAGQLLNLSDLARDAGISHTTANNWMSILETSYIIYQLPPYFKNYGKRLIKSPKLYFYDVGLLCHLLGIRKSNISPMHPSYGHVFENLIITELIKKNEHRELLRDYYFWRDSKGHEVDLMYHDGDVLHIYEIKSSSTIQSRMFEGLEYFTKISTEPIEEKVVVYGGVEVQNRTEFTVVPWSLVK